MIRGRPAVTLPVVERIKAHGSLQTLELAAWLGAHLHGAQLVDGVLSLWTRSSATSSRTIATRRPGWIARRRARGGIQHRRGRVGVGYRSAVGVVDLTARELAHHGALFGGPGSRKTTFLQLLVEASAGRMPVVIVDPKGSPALEAST
ncbi:MAG: type IV secretory system conjugative DNA transfer family protein [Chloroflexi bacterium]|nr:type IV secretory system conjugative DNA transfer family protein [Chloroflexota bacterium]